MIACLLFGCSSEKMTKPGEISEKPVQTSGNKNDWVKGDSTYWILDSTMYFKVHSDNEIDVASANDGLYLLAIQAIGFHIVGDATNYIGGARVENKYSKNAIGNAQRAFTLAISKQKFSCVKVKEYWEQFEKNEGNSVSYFYHIYALYSFPVDEYAIAKGNAWKEAKGMVISEGDKEAGQLLDEQQKDFLKNEK